MCHPDPARVEVIVCWEGFIRLKSKPAFGCQAIIDAGTTCSLTAEMGQKT
jgi:hypothetical protein